MPQKRWNCQMCLDVLWTSTNDGSWMQTSVKMRPKRGPWSQRTQGDCRGGYKTILWWILLYYSPAEEDIRLRVLFSSSGYNNLTELLPKEETQLGDCTVTNKQNTKNNNICSVAIFTISSSASVFMVLIDDVAPCLLSPVLSRKFWCRFQNHSCLMIQW